MTRPDPYKLLQVDREADPEIIQVAYRKLAQRYHPDVSSGAEADGRMAELNAARDLLLDPVARAAYDAERRARTTAPGGAEPAGAAHGDATRAAATRAGVGPAGGKPPGNPSGSVLTFGRYAGWSLGEIAGHDLEYVEWLDRTPIGRPHREEIDAILRRAGRRGPRTAREEPRGLFRRR